MINLEPNYKIELIDEETNNYFINASYPAISLPDNDLDININEQIKNLILSDINNFKDSIGEHNVDDIDMPVLISSLNTNINYFDQNVLSLAFKIDTYMAGAAHGFSYLIIILLIIKV